MPYYSGTIYIEVNIIIDEDESPMNCEIPFECETRICNSNDPQDDDSFENITIADSFCAPEWCGSSIIDHAEKKATEKWARDYEKFD